MKKDNITLGIDRALCEKDFHYFCRWIFDNVYGFRFIINWHFEVLCEYLQLIYDGKINRAIINIPPRYGKSETVVILFSVWCFLKNPSCNFIHISYSDSLALKNSNQIRQIIKSDIVKVLWEISLDRSEQAKKRWSIKDGGQFYATSSGGQVTGEGAGVKSSKVFSGALIIDDPHKADSERHEVQRDNVITNFERVLAPRLNDPKNTPVIVIMQRLHEGDLAGFLLSGKSILGKFDHLYLPAICEEKKHPLDRRETGDALWPLIHNTEQLKEMEKVNPYVFAGQYQQRPALIEGNIIKQEWIRHFKDMPTYELKIFSCDLNFHEKGKSHACYSVYIKNGENFYLIDKMRGHWGFTESLKNIIGLIKKHSDYTVIIVENKANGPALIDVMRNHGIKKILSWPPKGTQMKSKQERLHSVSPLYQTGCVYYPPIEISWVAGHKKEVTSFPYGLSDDAVDCESQALTYLNRQTPSFFGRYNETIGKSPWQKIKL